MRARARPAWPAIAAGSALGLATGWNVSNVGAVAQQLAASYRIALATVGLFTTALFLVHSAALIPSGHAVDRFGARRVGFLGLAVIAACNALAVIASDAALAIAARGLAGVGTAVCFVAGSEYVRAAGGSPLAQGLYGGVGLAGGGLALALVPQVEDWLSWRAPFVTALAIALAALAALAAGPADALRGAYGRSSDPRRRPFSVVGDRRLYRLAAMHTASLGLSVVVGNWAVTLLVREGGMSKGPAGAIAALTLALGLLTRPLGGLIAEQRPSFARAALAASLAVGALGTLALSFAKPLALAVAGSALVGLASGLPFALAFTGAARARPEAPGSAIAFVNTSANLAIVAGTPLLGLSFSLPGSGRPGFAVVALLWAAAVAALPSARELGLPERA